MHQSTVSINNISDMELISTIQRVCLKFNSSEKKIQSKWAQDLNKLFSSEDIQIVNKHMKKC